MNKSAIFSLVLAVISVLVIGESSLNLASVKEEVTITQTVLVGEESLVSDFHLNFITYDQYHNFWEIDYPLSAPENSQTTFRFNKNPWKIYPSVADSSFYLSTISNGSGSTNGIMDFEIMEQERLTDPFYMDSTLPYKMLNEVDNATELGESRTETLVMADYYENFPIGVHIYIGGSPYLSPTSYQKLEEYFKFPVPPELQLDITIEKNMEGVHSYSCQSAGGISSEIHQTFVMLEDGVIISTQLVTYEEKKDEWGYYYDLLEQKETQVTKILWDVDEEDGYNYSLEITEISQISTLDSSYMVVDMVELGENLAVLLQKDGDYSFSVRDKESFEELQSIPLAHDGHRIIEVDGAFLIFASTSHDSTTKFTVIEEENSHVFVALEGIDVEVLEEKEDYYYDNETYHYQDGVLTVLRGNGRYDWHLKDILVKVFDERGLLFASLYESSQKIVAKFYNGIDFLSQHEVPKITKKVAS